MRETTHSAKLNVWFNGPSSEWFLLRSSKYQVNIVMRGLNTEGDILSNLGFGMFPLNILQNSPFNISHQYTLT